MVDRELEAALRAVEAASRVENVRHSVSRDQRRHLATVVDRLMLEAVTAGATVLQVSAAVGLGSSRVQERLRRARRAKPDRGTRPVRTPVVGQNVWREVPMCGRPAPPPWPVSRRCMADAGHYEQHTFQTR